ncbi:MAG: cytochrome-c peroxidase [Saprospiraceae bacterium]
MKTSYFAILFLIVLTSCKNDADRSNSFEPNLVLEEFDYFEETIPYGNTPYNITENHDKIAALGRILFYDTRLSQNNSIACATCHKQDMGFSDNQQFSQGLKNYTTSRNSMALINNSYQISHFWEGHRGQLHEHILNPISNHIEMGMRDNEQLVEKLSEIESYNELFEQIYHNPINEEIISNALATFVASIISYNSKYDKGQQIDFVNFTASEKKGMELFFGKAKCSQCHGGDHLSASWRKNANIGLDMEYTDQGAGNGAFKVPSLRNIALTSPYMHDGRFQTLEEVVNHYVNGVQEHPDLDWTLGNKIELNEFEKKDLVEFLNTLTDYEVTTDQKFSNPF